MSRRLQDALRGVPSVATGLVAEYASVDAISGTVLRNGCDICFLDVASNPELAQPLIAELAPAVPVVALHHRADADLILRCLRRGACEFLTDPTADALRALFERLGRGRAAAAQRQVGAVYCVVPGKAGSGASTVAAHLAVAMATGGQTALLVDGDALTGSIAFLLKLKPEFHLGDALRDWTRMDDDLWSRLTVRAHGVDVLCAPESPGSAAVVDRESASDICAFWRERYRAVVIDMADARAAADSGFAPLADATLLITTNELAVLQASRRAIEYLSRTLPDRSRLRLVINRYTPATGLKREDVKTALGVEPYAILANDYEELQGALLEGMPARRGSRFAASVEELCGQLLHRPPAVRKSGQWLSLLRPHRRTASGK